MKRSLLVALGLVALMAAAACGSAGEHDASADDIGMVSSAATCSPEGKYGVPITGTQSYIYGTNYTCSGVLPYKATFIVDVTPGPNAHEWFITTKAGKSPLLKEDATGAISWFLSVTGDAAIAYGCGNSIRQTVIVKPGSVYVEHVCRFMSGNACGRYTDASGTLATSCVSPDAGAADASGEADATADAATEAGTEGDGSAGASREADASTAGDASPGPAESSDASVAPDAAESADGSLDEPEPPVEPPPSSGPADAAAPTEPDLGKPRVSCAMNGGASSLSSPGFASVALATMLAAARRRRARVRA